MAGARLRLIGTGAGTRSGSSGRRMEESAPRVLKFPGAVRDVVGPPDPARLDAASLAEQALRRLQIGMDALRDEFDPGRDGPRAA